MMAITIRTGYPVIDEILEMVAPQGGNEGDYNSEQQAIHDDYAHSRGRTVEHTQTCLRSGKCIQTEEPTTTTTAPDFTNWRVRYIAPQVNQTWEPYCYIEADSTSLGPCRVFDVPDPDEGQRAAAQLACDALNQRAGLVEALEDCVNLLAVASMSGKSLMASAVRSRALTALAHVRGE